MNVWRFFDTIYDRLDQIEVARDEGFSKASAARKNFDRSLGNVEPLKGKKKRGHKCDLILRSQATDHDALYGHGAGESGQYFGGVGCSKTLIESGIKLPKVLKDMYNDISCNAALNVNKLAKIEIVGYITDGKR